MDLGLECPGSDELRALALGESSDSMAVRLRVHLDTCQACRNRMEGLLGPTVATPASTPAKSLHADPYATLPGGKPAPAASEFSFLSPPVEEDEIGRLGTYRVLRVLGQGGMGVVFQAEDIGLSRPVALKVMRPELKSDPDGGQRFLREARAMASIKHDHLATIYQVGQQGDVPYFAMELLEGQSLDSWMQRTPAPEVSEIVRLGREIASGLAAIHERNLVHRDIKPANLWLEGPARRIKILDFGLARSAMPDRGLTVTGVVMGTPDYMSPEQARGDPVDARTDLFSLGCVLYTLCTRRKPFEGANVSAVLMALASETPPSVTSLNDRIPEPLSELVMELLARNPRKRPASAEEVRSRLEDLNRPPRDLRPHAARHAKQKPKKKGQEPAHDSHTEVLGPHLRLAAPRAQRENRWKGILIWSGVLAAFAALGIAVAVVAALRPKPAGFVKPLVEVPEAEKTFLSDLPQLAAEHWPFEMGPGGPKKDVRKKGGKEPPPPGKEIDMTVWFNGKRSPHGIFMHPPVPPDEGEPASLSYSLRKQYANFQAEVSLNDEQESESPCIFWVYGDGKVLWKSRPVSTPADTQRCTVSVKDVDTLKIAVTCDGPPRGAHAIWVEPFLAK